MKQTQNRSSLFLLELIIDLFLFVICAAVCVGLLLHAHSMSLESRALTQAVYVTQTVVERYRGGENFAGVYSSEGTFIWKMLPPTSDAFIPYDYTVDISEESGLLNVFVYRDDKLIYSLEGVSRDG